MKKSSIVLSALMALTLIFAAVAGAFSDLPSGLNREKINSLRERGIVSGYGNLFKGEQALTNAEGIHLIVNTTEISLAAFLFMTEPLASDYFDNVDNDAWYAQSLVIAAVNGLDLPQDLDPDAEMTREAFAHHLLTALLVRGEYAFTRMYFPVEDEADVNPDYMYSLQLLFNGRIITLEEDGVFLPKEPVTREDAAVWAFNTAEFIQIHEAIPAEPNATEEPAESLEGDVVLLIEAVNDDVNKITVSWGEKPNSGYAISITGITFKNDGTAEILYQLHYPEEDMMYLQVITYPEVSTYLAAGFEPVLVQSR